MYTLHKTEGVILRAQDTGEADKMFTIFTRDFGKITVHARGARLAQSKLKGHLNVLSRARLAFVDGRDILRLTDAEEEENYFYSLSPVALSMLGRAARLIDRLVQGTERDEMLWDLFFDYLEKLKTVETSAPALEVLFAARSLNILGYVNIEDEHVGGLLAEGGWETERFLPIKDKLEDLCRQGLAASHL